MLSEKMSAGQTLSPILAHDLKHVPPLTPTLEAVEQFACYPPQVRAAAVRLYCGESGLHSGEFWHVAAAWIDGGAS